METAWPNFAGEAVCIAENSCQFRIEWLCPLKSALEHVHVGNARMCKVGYLREYLVRFEAAQNEVTWHMMNNWGPFLPR